jgi:hypothetical protein
MLTVAVPLLPGESDSEAGLTLSENPGGLPPEVAL